MNINMDIRISTSTWTWRWFKICSSNLCHCFGFFDI